MSFNSLNSSDSQSAAKFLKGQVIHVSGLPTKNVNFGTLKDFFNNYAPDTYKVYEHGFLYYKQGSSEASLQFHTTEENAAVKALKKMNEDAKETDGKIRFRGHEIKCRVLEGEEEEKFWLDYAENMSDNAQNMSTYEYHREKPLSDFERRYREAIEMKIAENAMKKQKKKDQSGKKTDFTAKFFKGQVLHVSGLPTENVNIGILKDFFKEYAPVGYADYEQGSSEAFIRFRSRKENAAVKALEKMDEDAKDGKIKFQEYEIKCRVIEGEEEEKYYEYLNKRTKCKSKVEAEPAKSNNTGYFGYVFDTFDYLKEMIWNSNE